MPFRLLYFNPSVFGGLADYAHEQANALADSGVIVEMLVTRRYQRGNCRYQIHPVLQEESECGHLQRLSVSAFPLLRRYFWVKCLFRNYRVLRHEIDRGEFRLVLLGAYAEYMAPLWAGRFRTLARRGVKFGAIVHDPVRDYQIGPRWWHRRSIADAYSFLSEAFVHEDIQLDTVRPAPDLRTTVIPHGPFQFPTATETRARARERLTLPADATVLLSFGHIRDGKNLDLVIRALVDFPSVYLVVAGKEQSPAQKPIGYYQELARSLGVQDRCRWFHGHVPQDQIGNLFEASDLSLLTYSKNFRSASGVLNAAVRYRKPCLASSGSGNLQSVVERYDLGWFVEPDNFEALKAGLAAALRGGINPRWDAYESENSWQRNAEMVKERMFGA